MRGEQNRYKNRCAQNDVLSELYSRGRDKWPATQVIRVQGVAQSIRRKCHRSGKPDQTHREIEPARECVERSRFRVIDAAKAVRLHQSVPDAPEENDQQNSFEVPPKE